MGKYLIRPVYKKGKKCCRKCKSELKISGFENAKYKCRCGVWLYYGVNIFQLHFKGKDLLEKARKSKNWGKRKKRKIETFNAEKGIWEFRFVK